MELLFVYYYLMERKQLFEQPNIIVIKLFIFQNKRSLIRSLITCSLSIQFYSIKRRISLFLDRTTIQLEILAPPLSTTKTAPQIPLKRKAITLSKCTKIPKVAEESSLSPQKFSLKRRLV